MEELYEEVYNARFDILEWWRLNAAKDKVLFAIARAVLAIHILQFHLSFHFSEVTHS